MSTEKMREEFEVWVSKKYPNESLHKCRADRGFIYCVGDYVVPAVHIAWLSWQASRAAIEVELPESFEHESYGFLDPLGSAIYVDELTEVIRSLGLKVKPC